MVVPVRFTVPRLIKLPENAPDRLAVAPALLTRLPFNDPVDTSVPLLITPFATVPALVNTALLVTEPASDAPEARTSVPPLTSVWPVKLLAPVSVKVPVPSFSRPPLPEITPAKLVLALLRPS